MADTHGFKNTLEYENWKSDWDYWRNYYLNNKPKNKVHFIFSKEMTEPQKQREIDRYNALMQKGK